MVKVGFDTQKGTMAMEDRETPTKLTDAEHITIMKFITSVQQREIDETQEKIRKLKELRG